MLPGFRWVDVHDPRKGQPCALALELMRPVEFRPSYFTKGVLVVVTLIPAGRKLWPARKNRERVSLRYDNAPETNSIVCYKCVESCVFVRGRN